MCFPQAGAGTGTFGGWRKQVHGDLELVAVRLPGRESLFSQPLVSDLQVIGGALGDLVAGAGDAVPVGLFGYCAGAFTALEVARRMTKLRKPPSVLAVCSQVAPQASAAGPRLHDRPWQELKELLRLLGGTDPAVLDDDEAWITVEPALRADYEALETYPAELEPKIGCDIIAFHGIADDRVELSGVAAWAELTTGHFTMTRVPGGHFLLASGAADVLAELERRLLAQAGPPGPCARARDI